MGIFKKKDKKISTYKTLLMCFTILMIGLSITALVYVYKSLQAYEKGDINVYMTSLMKDLKKSVRLGNLEKYIEKKEINSPYETNSSLEKGYKELISNSGMTYEKSDVKNIYDIYASDKLIMSVELDDSKTETRLGLLTYTDYEIKDIKTYHDNGLYELDFYIADNYSLYINDVLVNEKDLKEESKIEEFSEVYDLVDLPTLNHYHINNLTYKPEIVIKDENEKVVKYVVDGNNYYANTFYKTDSKEEAMNKLNFEYDPLEFAKNWSLFLTDDLKGTRHGLYKLTQNLIEGTEMYQRAYNWATNVDITFTSNHYLAKEVFTNTKVSNFTIYNENAFSAEVYLEKNMVLRSGKKRQDVLHDILYFVYYDGAYRLVHMKTVTD